jgi:hypothetical protein
MKDKKWEYEIQTFNLPDEEDNLLNVLDMLGNQRWEIVSVTDKEIYFNNTLRTVIFKRWYI